MTESGAGVDAEGRAVLDPTANVLGLVEAAIKRTDDLREAAVARQDDLRRAESRHVREVAALRAEYAAELRRAEAERIDAIRAVDVGAVNRAAEVQSAQAITLANQVATSAETLRAQVAAAAAAAAVALSNALEPIQKSIDDLRRAQYEQQGQKAQQTESGTGSRAWVAIVIAASIGFGGLLLSVAAIVVTFVLKG